MPIQIRKEVFSAKANCQDPDGGYLSNLNNWLKWLFRLLVTGFFAPAIAISSLLLKDYLLIISNVTLALGHTINFLYRGTVEHSVSTFEIILTLAVTSALVWVSLSGLATGVIATAGYKLAFLNYLNAISTSINAFFTVKNIILPLISKVISSLLYCCGIQVEFNLYRFPLFDKSKIAVVRNFPEIIQDDQIKLRRLSEKDFAENPKIKTINTGGVMLDKYLNKYTASFFGAIFAGGDIDRRREDQTAYQRGNCVKGRDFFKSKLRRKVAKAKDLLEALQELEELSSQHQTGEEEKETGKSIYQSKLMEYTTWRPARRAPQSVPEFAEVKAAFDSAIRYQTDKIADFYACLPPDTRAGNEYQFKRQ